MLNPGGLEGTTKILFGEKGSSKYLYGGEVESVWNAGKDLLIYNHFPRENHYVFSITMKQYCEEHLSGSTVYPIIAGNVLYLHCTRKNISQIKMFENKLKEVWKSEFELLYIDNSIYLDFACDGRSDLKIITKDNVDEVIAYPNIQWFADTAKLNKNTLLGKFYDINKNIFDYRDERNYNGMVEIIRDGKIVMAADGRFPYIRPIDELIQSDLRIITDDDIKNITIEKNEKEIMNRIPFDDQDFFINKYYDSNGYIYTNVSNEIVGFHLKLSYFAKIFKDVDAKNMTMAKRKKNNKIKFCFSNHPYLLNFLKSIGH
jgi:hypothetical protein